MRAAVAEKLYKKSCKPTLVKKQIHSIPPDGRCFWYAWIACSTSDKWWTIDRSEAGYAKSKERLKTEEAMGEGLLQEVMGKLISISSSEEMTNFCKEVKDWVSIQTLCELQWGCRRYKISSVHLFKIPMFVLFIYIYIYTSL